MTKLQSYAGNILHYLQHVFDDRQPHSGEALRRFVM